VQTGSREVVEQTRRRGRFKMPITKSVRIAAVDTAKWLLLTSTIGLAPLVLHAVVSLFVHDIYFAFGSVMEGGALMSFCLALVSAIFFDAHFQRKHNQNLDLELFDDLIFKLFPWIIVFMVTVSTVLLLVLGEEEIDRDALINTQIAAVAMSYLYTGYYKYVSFLAGLSRDV
jgi:amino acid transporter